MKFNICPILYAASALLFVACKPSLEAPQPQKGNADFSNYVAIGSAQTAGYADGALYHEAQQNSYANLLAGQFEAVGGIDFKIPYVSSTINGVSVITGNTITINAMSQLAMKTDCKGVTALGPLKLTPNVDYSYFSENIYSASSPFNNMAVPYTKAIHLLAKGYGNSANNYFNPYYKRMASNINASSIINDAINQNPTFFSLMIGGDDVMAYALAGGFSDTITTTARFSTHIDSVIYYLTKNGAKGVIANIPSLNSIPYFTTIAYNALTLDSAKAASLNQFYFSLDPNIHFNAGANAFIVEDASTFIGLRQAVAGEYILLNVPLDDVKCNSLGSLIPINNKYVLSLTEVNAIESAIFSFNTILKTKAQNNGLAFVDVNAFYQKNKESFIYNNITFNYNFVKGGLFSLDGLNFTPRGHALLANEFVRSINETYQSTIRKVDVVKYRGIVFP